MKALRARMAAEGLLVGLGVVVGKTVGWVLIVVFGLILVVEGFRWARERWQGAPRAPEPLAPTRPLTYADLAAIRVPVEHDPDSLANQVDDLIREGMDLVTEFSVPVQPEGKEGAWQISGGDAPQEWQDKADDFQGRIRQLFQAHHPALLADFRDGAKRHFQMEREAEEARKQDATADTRSDGEKMLALANWERSGPRREVEAFLEGLALARKTI